MEYFMEKNWMVLDIPSMQSVQCETVEHFLARFIPSKKMQYFLLSNGWLRMDGEAVKRGQKLQGKKLSVLLYPYEKGYKGKRGELPEVVYEDEILLVACKPHGLNVHDVGNGAWTLQDQVEAYFARKGMDCLCQPVHRLDKETKGLVVFCKSEVFQPLLDRMVFEKQIGRRYLALVKGECKAGTRFDCTEPIGKDCQDSGRRVVCRNGQKAVTHVESLGTNKKYSVLKCALETGRTHQIRVHLSCHHFPVVNDPLYGKMDPVIWDMGLVGYEISFVHPLSGKNIILHTEPEEDFQKAVAEIHMPGAYMDIL